MVKHSQSSQNSKFAMSSQYLKKKLEIKSIICMQINIKLSQKLISTVWASWFSQGILLLLMGTFKHSQRTQSNKFAISLQYLKKEVRNRFIFYMQINIKVSASWGYCFWWKWPDMSKVPKIGSINSHFELVGKCQFLSQTLIRELI